MPKLATSPKEVQDLFVACLVVSLAFAFALRPGFFGISVADLIPTFIVSIFVVGSSFVLHELLHKFTAQRFGFWSEFRADYMMLILSLFLSYITRIVIAAPGATLISGPNITKRQNGMISAAGPLLNLGLAGLYLLFVLIGGAFALIAYYGFVINIWLSAFNLLPIGMFDGRKVLAWGVPQYVVIAALPFIGAVYVFLTIFY